MFHWICPECGREIAPTVRECPACDPNAEPLAAAPASEPAVDQPAALTPEIVASSPARSQGRSPAFTEGRFSGKFGVPVLDAETVVTAIPEPAAVIPHEPYIAPPTPAREPERLGPVFRGPASITVAAPPAEDSGDVPVAAPPAASSLPAAAQGPPPAPPTPEPEILEASSPLLPDASQLPLDFSAPAQPPDPLLALVEGVQPGYVPMQTLASLRPKGAPLAPRKGQPEPLSSEGSSPATPDPRPRHREHALGTAAALKQAPQAAASGPGPRGLNGPEPAEPGAPQRPAPELPPPELPIGSLQGESTGAVMSRIRPVNPTPMPRGGEPMARVTLAGPTLPHELTSLAAAGISAPLAERARKAQTPSFPGWAVSFLVAVILLAGSLGLAFYLMPGMLAGSPPAPVKTEVKEEPRPASHPLAKYVEVTGFRFVTERDRSASIHYLVVNHSPALLSGVTVFVTLRTKDAQPGQPPMSTFSFPMPDLGPYESKEMISSIEKVTRPGLLPDWRDLNVQVDIAQ